MNEKDFKANVKMHCKAPFTVSSIIGGQYNGRSLYKALEMYDSTKDTLMEIAKTDIDFQNNPEHVYVTLYCTSKNDPSEQLVMREDRPLWDDWSEELFPNVR